MFWQIVLWIASFALNLLLTPKPQNHKAASLEDFEVPTAEEGREIPVLFGTRWISGPNVVWYGDLKAKGIKGGPRRYLLFGPRQTIGHEYYLGIQMILCHGELDVLRRIKVDSKYAWRGWRRGSGQIQIDEPEFFGGKDRLGGLRGSIDIEMGGPTQGKNDYLVRKLGSGVPAHRGVVGAVLRQMYLGNSPYIAAWEFLVQRVFTRSDGSQMWYNQKAGIGSIDVSDTAIYIAQDVSGSMYWEGGIEMARPALIELMHMIRANYPSGNLDLRLVGWDHEMQSFIEKRNILSDSDWAAIDNWIEVDMNGGGGTDFLVGVVDAVDFFLGGGSSGAHGNITSTGSGGKRRVLIFITDGSPNAPSTATAARALMDTIPELEMFAFNIEDDYTFYTEFLDNTPSDFSWEIYNRAYNASNVAIGLLGQYHISIYTVDDQINDAWISEPITELFTPTYSPGQYYAMCYRTYNRETLTYDIYATVWIIQGLTVPTSWGSVIAPEKMSGTSGSDKLYASIAGLVPVGGQTWAPWICTWTDTGAADGSGMGIFAKFYSINDDHSEIFQVNTTTAGSQKYSKVIGLTDGGFLIVWQSRGVDDSHYGVVGQRYDDPVWQGPYNPPIPIVPIGTEFLISTQNYGLDQTRPSLCVRSDSKVVVAWLTDGIVIEQVVLDPDTNMSVINGDVVTATPGVKSTPEVAHLATGGHVVVWGAADDTGGDYNVYAQRYNGAGVKAGAAILVNTTTSNHQNNPSVDALKGGVYNGGFVVVWQSYLQDGDDWGIYSRRFDSTGAPIDAEFQVHDVVEGSQLYPAVVGLSGLGGSHYAVQWQDSTSPPVPVIKGGASEQFIDSISRAFYTNFDANPAHIIRECLIDRVWGLGYNETDIDDDSFQEAADTLFNEGFGLTLLWQHEEELEKFITTVLAHIDAMLYISRESGRFVLKLIRPDYNIDDLLVIGEDDVVTWENIKRRQPSEAVNSLSVAYYDRVKAMDSSVYVHNPAAVAQVGGIISAHRQYPGITKRELAIRVATRDLQSMGAGMADGRIYCKRTVEGLNPGDAFRLLSEDQGFSGEVMRVTEITFGDGKSNAIVIKFVQDVFNLPSYVLVDASDTEDDDQVPLLVPVAPRMVHEMPYWELIQEMGQVEYDSLVAIYPEFGVIQIAGGDPGSGSLYAITRIDSGSGYASPGNLDFSPAGYLLADLLALATDVSFTLTTPTNLTDVEVGTMVWIGDEICKVVSVTGSDIVVARGCLDTVPRKHIAGTGVVFFDGSAFTDLEVLLAGDLVEVRLQTVGAAGTLALNDAPPDLVTFASRGIRPYPVGKLQADALYNTPAPPPYNVTWTHRDRPGQTTVVEHVQGSYGPEAGVSYQVDVYSIYNDGTIEVTPFYTDNVGTALLYVFNPATDVPDVGAEAVLFKITSLRGGYENWQSAMLAAPLGVLTIFGTPITDIETFDDYYFLLTATGGIPPYTYALAPGSGALPSGISVNATSGAVGGVASAAGTYSGIVMRVTDLYGNFDDLPSFTITVGVSTLPEPFIYMDFQNEIYIRNSVVVPMTDLTTGQNPTYFTPLGMTNAEGSGHQLLGTALMKTDIEAMMASGLGINFVFEIDYDGVVPTTSGALMAVMTTVDGPFGEDDFTMDKGDDGTYYGANAGNRYDAYVDDVNFLPNPNIIRSIVTITRHEGGFSYQEYTIQGGIHGISYYGGPPFNEATGPDDEDWAYWMTPIDEFVIGGYNAWFYYSDFYFRKFEIYEGLTPTQAVTIAARGMPWELRDVHRYLPFGKIGEDYRLTVLYYLGDYIGSQMSLPDTMWPYGAKVTALGGEPTYSYNVTSGTLPPGLSLATGNLGGGVSGTPTTNGSYTFEITASDTDGNSTAAPPFTINISDHYAQFIGVRQLQTTINGPLGTGVSSGYVIGPDDPNRKVIVIGHGGLDFGQPYYQVTIGHDDLSGTPDHIHPQEPMTQVLLKNSITLDGDMFHCYMIDYPVGNTIRIYWKRQAIAGNQTMRVYDAIYTVTSPDELRVAGVQITNPTASNLVAYNTIPAPTPRNGFTFGVTKTSLSSAGMYMEFKYREAGLDFIYLRDTSIEPDGSNEVTTVTSPFQNGTPSAFITLQPETLPYVKWYHPSQTHTAKNYTVLMCGDTFYTGYTETHGDMMVAHVMHRSAITQVPEGWVLVDMVTYTGASTTQYLSMYTRRAWSDEGVETWQQTTASAMAVQYQIVNSGSGYLSLADYDTYTQSGITTNSNLLVLAPVTGTADDQIAISGGALITSLTGFNVTDVVSGVWSTHATNNPDANTRSHEYNTYDMKMYSGWRGIQTGEVFDGSFRNYSITSTDNNGQGSITALLDLAPLVLTGEPNYDLRLNAVYDGFTIVASQGTPTYTYSVASGTLPTGVTLNTSSGFVSGTPTVGGIYEGIVLRVTDSTAATADLPAFTLIVNDGVMSVSLVHTATNTTASPTFTSVNFGAADPTRVILVTWTHAYSSQPATAVGDIVSIGGVAAKELIRAQAGPVEQNANACMAMVVLPSGTSGSVVVSAALYNRHSIAVYRIVNMANLKVPSAQAIRWASFGNHTSLPNTATVAAHAGDAVFGVGTTWLNGTWVPTGDLTVDYAAAAASGHYGVHASRVVAADGNYNFGRPLTDGFTLCAAVVQGNNRKVASAVGTSTATAVGSGGKLTTGTADGVATCLGDSPGPHDGTGTADGVASCNAFGTRFVTSITADSTVVTADQGPTVDRSSDSLGSSTGVAAATGAWESLTVDSTVILADRTLVPTADYAMGSHYADGSAAGTSSTSFKAPPQFVATSGLSFNSGGTVVNHTIPATARPGDLLYMVCCHANPITVPPSGWTQVTTDTAYTIVSLPTYRTLTTFIKIAVLADAGATASWTASPSGVVSGQVMVFRGSGVLSVASSDTQVEHDVVFSDTTADMALVTATYSGQLAISTLVVAYPFALSQIPTASTGWTVNVANSFSNLVFPTASIVLNSGQNTASGYFDIGGMTGSNHAYNVATLLILDT